MGTKPIRLYIYTLYIYIFWKRKAIMNGASGLWLCVRILGCLLGFLVSVNAAFRRICHGPHGTFSQSQQFWFPSPPSASTHFLLISRNLTTCSSSTCMLLCLNTWVFLFYMIVYTFSTCIYKFWLPKTIWRT